ncbi:GGDEF domain-containing protein, partial [Pseudoalteromonas sp. S1609]|uniref:EAL domain-containing protein n=1 Tax=Pseudoalteromonas sp. S1609 TaxID=579505 RepID=UPI00110B2274
EQAELRPVIRQALRNAALPPEAMVIEITESILMRDSENALKNLAALKQLGSKVYMDAFGRGFASFTYIKLFPIDEITLDLRF